MTPPVQSRPLQNIVTVLQSLPTRRNTHRNTLGATLIVVNLASWAALFVLTVFVDQAWLKLLLGTMLGVNTGTLFVIGHDASHGGLTSSARFNRLAALLAFLPSLHPPTSWEWGHNRMHHSWTNLASRDDGYPPLTFDQWCSLSPARQRLHRAYHTMWGMGFYYMIDVWWTDLILLSKGERAQLRTERRFFVELVVLGIFVAAQVAVVLGWGAWQSEGALATAWRFGEVMLCVVWPFIVWNWVMAFVTLQHHTHPRVRWFDNVTEWSYFQSQIAGTVHMTFPRVIELAFANIFEHTAHHADKLTPLYNLRATQIALEEQYPEHVIVQRASLAHLRDILKRCRLYDYRAGRWMDFDGRYTT